MNTQIKLAIIAIVIVIPLSSFAVSQTNSSSQFSSNNDTKLQVITSANFLYEFSQNIGNEMIDVTLLVPMGVDPHDWEPTIRDRERLQKADVIIVNGIGYEHWIGSFDSNNNQGIIVDTSNGISTLDFEKHDDHAKEDGHEDLDPHIWLNPVYAQLQVKNIANALSNSDRISSFNEIETIGMWLMLLNIL